MRFRVFTVCVAALLAVACSDPKAKGDRSLLPTPAEPVAAAGKLQLGQPLPDFELPLYDEEGSLKLSSLYDGKSYVVVTWYSPSCPCVANCLQATVDQMPPDKYPDVKWVGVMSDAQWDVSWMKRDYHTQREEAGLFYPVVLDADQSLMKAWGAERTPTVWLVDPQGRIRFWGAPESSIEPTASDNRFLLKEAIDALKAGREPEVSTFPPLGCLITVPHG